MCSQNGRMGMEPISKTAKKTVCSFSLCCSMSRTKQMAAGGQRSNLFCIKLAQQRSRGQDWYTFIYINSLFLSCLFFNRKNAEKQFKATAMQCNALSNLQACSGSESGSISQRYGSGSGSFYQQAKIVRKPLIPTVL